MPKHHYLKDGVCMKSIQLHRGTLAPYSHTQDTVTRHKHLMKAALRLQQTKHLSKKKALEIVRKKLQVLHNLTYRRYKTRAAIYGRDARWVSRKKAIYE